MNIRERGIFRKYLERRGLKLTAERQALFEELFARHEHLDKSTLTRNLKTILSEGWVEEVRDNADGRSRPIALTAAGKELLIKAQPAWLAAQAEARAILGKDGIIAVVSIAGRILNP